MNTQPIRPHDFWWHLALGREIASSGAIPTMDLYSYVLEGTPYPSYQMFWFADLILYGFYNLGGPALVIFIQSLLITTTYGLLLWLCWQTSQSLRVTAVSVLMAIALGINNWNVRPQVISYFLGVLFLVAIFSYRRSGNRYWLAILPLGMLIWVNSHGSFVIGLVLISIWVADELWQVILKRYRGSGNQSYANLWISMLSMGVTALVCIINPRGLGIISYVRSLTANPAVQNLVPEWAPPNFDDLYGIMFYGVLMFSAVILAISPKRPSFIQLSTFVIFGILGLRTSRGVVWFGIVMAPILTAHISELVRACQPSPGKARDRTGKPAINWLFAGLILVIVLISLPWFKEYLPFPRNKAGLISSETPLIGTQFLLDEKLEGELFNEIGFGSYLIWAAYPDYQVFVDPRIELYPLELWLDYAAIGNALPGWENLADKYSMNTMMLNPINQAPLVAALEESPEWLKNFQDQAVVIFGRKSN